MVGYVLATAVDRNWSERVSVGLKAQCTHFDAFESDGYTGDLLRSQPPNLRLAGSEPVSAWSCTGDTGRFSALITVRYTCHSPAPVPADSPVSPCNKRRSLSPTHRGTCRRLASIVAELAARIPFGTAWACDNTPVIDKDAARVAVVDASARSRTNSMLRRYCI